MDRRALWNRYQRYLAVHPSIGLWLDISRMKFGELFFDELKQPIEQAFDAMEQLEKGVIANPDENRQVGHYWLRAPQLAPSAELRTEIEATLTKIKGFAQKVHSGAIRPPKADRYRNILHVGIGGSALGPQLVDAALGSAQDPMRIFFLDNTDPDGIDLVLDRLGASGLAETLVLVVSKSGSTKETRNGMLEAMRAFEQAGLAFATQAVAITQKGSTLSKMAEAEGWLDEFPMWDWVGGRTSETSAVGLLPAALQGFDIDALLEGARLCDEATRVRDPLKNPSMLLALMWLYATSGPAPKDMVVLPYKDRLGLMSRYLQQLIMESLGKARDLAGHVVHQGISVYGNKGSTDQHAYVQQLREGANNFFVTFIEVQRDRQGKSHEVEPQVTTGDYLLGFLLGTRQALFDNDRESITLTLQEMSPKSLGVLIALYERAVGFYASLVGINAYHQPGVEAGKKAATSVIALQTKLLEQLRNSAGTGMTLEQIAKAAGAQDQIETVFKLLEHLSANEDRPVLRTAGPSLFEATYALR